MTKTHHDQRSRSLSQKLALASGAAAAFAGVAAPQLAEAEIIRSTTLPLSSPVTAGDNFWDVDNDGTDDFVLVNNSSTASLIEIDPARFVSPAARTQRGFAKLNAGFIVGGSMVGGYKFFNSAQQGIGITTSGSIASEAGPQGWALGDIGFFGFKFSNTSGVHYGWGQINIHGATGGFVVGQGFTFTEAYYNTTPDASITVDDRGTAVPEIDPASAGSVLSLVMGSLAMLERRRMRRAADASATTVSA